MTIRTLLASAAALTLASSSFGAITLSPLTSFGGNGDGWRAPSEVITGDSTGATYAYLGVGGLERGLDYNPATGNLILVSRSTAGNGIRILNGSTGADLGALPQGTGVITGGTFATSMVGVGTDGAIYVNNLTANASTSVHKIYTWSSETASAPTVFANAAASAFRIGDSLDVTGGGSSTRVVAGYSGTTGYVAYDNTGALSNVNPIAGAGAGEFRLGITFASGNEVWGKQTGATAIAAPVRRTSYSGSAGTNIGTSTLQSGGEMAMDYAEFSVSDANNLPIALKLLATLDANSSIVRVYDVTTPATPVLLTSLTTTSGTLTANGNAVGSIAFGGVNGNAVTLYAMSTNQGIQAMTLTIPEPASLSALAGLGMLMGRRRK